MVKYIWKGGIRAILYKEKEVQLDGEFISIFSKFVYIG